MALLVARVGDRRVDDDVDKKKNDGVEKINIPIDNPKEVEETETKK